MKVAHSMERLFALVTLFSIAACGSGGSSNDSGGAGSGGSSAGNTTTYTVGGSVTGLTGSGLVLQNNGGNDLPIAAAANFAFTTRLPSGGIYSVTVLTQPTTPSQTCSVSNGNGMVGSSNVNSVAVVCTTNSSGSGAPSIVKLIESSVGVTLAIDSTGATHVSATASVNGQYSVLYAKCATACNQDASWNWVPVSQQSSVSYVPTIALTQDGRPRILYASDMGSANGFHYIQCDSACDKSASWSDVQLTTVDPPANPTPRPHVPFAVSPGGRAAFIYGDNFNMYALYCAANCADRNSWAAPVTLGGSYTYPTSAAFSDDQSLQVVARRQVQNDETLQFLDCIGDCAVGTNWTGFEGLWTTTGSNLTGTNEIQAEIARTSQGGSRVIIYADDPNTSTVERVFAYTGCDSQCRTPANWKAPLLLPLAPDSSNVGFSLALNSSGLPTVAYLGDSASGYLSCTGDCTAASGTWQAVAGVSAGDLNQLFPATVPASCTSASWGIYTGPALALDASGKPAIAITAQARGLGGQCGTGSAATTTDTFLSLPQ